MTTEITSTVVDPTAIISETLNDAVRNAYTDPSETLAHALVETYVEDGYDRSLVERIIGSVDPDWLTAQVLKPQIHTRLAAERLRGRRPHIDNVAARSFGSTEELFTLISDGDWHQVVDRGGTGIHWILCQVIVLAVEAFFLTAEEAAGRNAKPNVVEQQALAMLASKIGSNRRGRALAVRQASQRAGFLPIPADDATVNVFAPAVRPAADFTVDLPKTDHANVLVRGAWVQPAQPKLTYLVGMSHQGGKEFDGLTPTQVDVLMRDITAQAHQKLIKSFSSVYVLDFYATILTALIAKVDAASVDVGIDDEPTTELQARRQDGPHLITWKEIDDIRGFSKMNHSDEHLEKIRQDLTEFVNLLKTIQASSGVGRYDFHGHLIWSDGVRTLRGPCTADGRNRRGQFDSAYFTLGVAMSTWLYGQRKRGLAPRFSSLYLPHLASGIPTASRSPIYLRQQLLVAAIATKTNDEHMRAADSAAAKGAGATGATTGAIPWWRDSTRPTVGLTLGELSGIGIRILQPVRTSANAAGVASNDRARQRKLLRELLNDLIDKKVIVDAWIHGDDPESASEGFIHLQPATARVVVVLPNLAHLEHQAGLAAVLSSAKGLG